MMPLQNYFFLMVIFYTSLKKYILLILWLVMKVTWLIFRMLNDSVCICNLSYVQMHAFIYGSFYGKWMPACLFACLPVWLPACVIAYPLACLSVCLSTSMTACMYDCLPTCLHVCLPASMTTCIIVCLSIWMYDCLHGYLLCCLIGCYVLTISKVIWETGFELTNCLWLVVGVSHTGNIYGHIRMSIDLWECTLTVTL